MQEKKAVSNAGRIFLTIFLLMALFGTAFGISLVFSKNKDKNPESIDIIPEAEIKLPKTLTPPATSTPTPVVASQAIIGKGCKVGGCNSEVCLNENDEVAATSCVFLNKYECYKKAKCEKQTDGDCDWTSTQTLNSCLTEAGKNLEENKFCGGIAAVSCPDGFSCKLDSTYPDSGGKCVKN